MGRSGAAPVHELAAIARVLGIGTGPTPLPFFCKDVKINELFDALAQECDSMGLIGSGNEKRRLGPAET
jgi:hypothetical protein